MARGKAPKTEALDDLLVLAATWSAVTRVLEGALKDADISLQQAFALSAIQSAPQPLLLSGLASRLVQEAQSITSMMDRLDRAGWAQRVHDLPDRRAIRVGLTEAGRAKAEEIAPPLVAAAGRVVGTLDGTQQTGLREGVVALYEACRSQPGVRLPELPGGK